MKSAPRHVQSHWATRVRRDTDTRAQGANSWERAHSYGCVDKGGRWDSRSLHRDGCLAAGSNRRPRVASPAS
ncbi:unnamed protein product [Lampetra fluviatilis]